MGKRKQQGDPVLHEFFKTLEMTAHNLIFQLPSKDSPAYRDLDFHGRFQIQPWEFDALVFHLARLIRASKECAEFHNPTSVRPKDL